MWSKFLCFLDADDIWMPNFLDLHLTFRRNNPNLAITYSPYYVFAKNNSRIFGYSVNPPNKVDLNNIFQNITLADDLEFNYSTNSPTMHVEGMIVGGK